MNLERNTDKSFGKNDLISIIVPVYNVEKYLVKCLDSIINQTYKYLEIILIDDGSTDGSGRICDEYAKKDNRIKVLHKGNGGLSSARNVGLDMSAGQYIAFVDSDDWLELDMYEYLMKNRAVDGITVCGYYQGDEKIYNTCKIAEKYLGYKSWYEAVNIVIDTDFDTIINRKKGTVVGNYAWNKLYKREVFNNIRYPENRLYEDMFIFPKLAKAAKILKFLPEAKYWYRYRPGSITKSISVKNDKDLILARLEYEKIFSKERFKYDQCRLLTSHAYLRLANSYFCSSQIQVNKKEINKIMNNLKIRRDALYLCSDWKFKIRFFLLYINPVFYNIVRFSWIKLKNITYNIRRIYEKNIN